MSPDPFQPAFDVLSGVADVGALTAGNLEVLRQFFNISLDSFRILNQQTGMEGMPFEASMDLYPGTAIVAVPGVPKEVVLLPLTVTKSSQT